MNIYLIEGQAFAEIVDNCLLLICSEEEFHNSTDEEVREMVDNAIEVKRIEAGK